MWHISSPYSSIFRTLVRQLIDEMFLSYWLCWCFVRYCRNENINIGYLNHWLTDFVFVPIILHFSTVIYNQLININGIITLKLWQAIFLSTYVAVVFEIILPQTTPYNVADWGDTLAYCLGALWYTFVHQKVYVHRRLQAIKF
jgi:hypothetical protein